MEEIKIKPCPFCNEEFTVEETESGGFIARHENETCPMLTDGQNGYVYNDPDQLIKEYNTRPVEDALRARISKLEQELADAWCKAAELEGKYRDLLAEQKRARRAAEAAAGGEVNNG
jgi:hypothetical protein